MAGEQSLDFSQAPVELWAGSVLQPPGRGHRVELSLHTGAAVCLPTYGKWRMPIGKFMLGKGNYEFDSSSTTEPVCLIR